ncbi:MAG: hypothetical protein IKH24_08225 [Bacteroidales bacterium]|nr:hypothetical protein [Bacteroidales bacterium]
MATWIIRYDKLDTDQKNFVNTPITGNTWIAGFAGSGKSVLLVNKAVDLLNKQPGLRIVFVVYTQSLVDLFKTGLAQLGMPNISVVTVYDFLSGSSTYDYVLCDEVQDLSASMVQAIRSRCSRYAIVAGDKFQSIFEKDVKYGQPTVDPVALRNLLNANVTELTKIYRLTPSIIDAVDKFLPTMHLAINGRPNAEKRDVSIKLCKCMNKREESSYVYNSAERYIKQRERTAILFPQHKDCIEFVNNVLDSKGKPQWVVTTNSYGRPNYRSMNDHLAANGIKLMYIGNGYGSLKEAEDRGIGVLMTYFSAKGLDFENVYMPYVSRDMFITYDEQRCKTVFMVAMTRSSNNLTISYCGMPHQYVERFRAACTQITPESQSAPVSSGGVDFNF